jgi:hypothetical protein
MHAPDWMTRRQLIHLGGGGLGTLVLGLLHNRANAQNAEVARFKPKLTRPPDFAPF